MKSIDARYASFAAKPERRGQSTLTVFMGAVKGARFARKVLMRGFNKLVDKDDYARSDKKSLIAYAEELSNGAEAGIK